MGSSESNFYRPPHLGDAVSLLGDAVSFLRRLFGQTVSFLRRLFGQTVSFLRRLSGDALSLLRSLGGFPLSLLGRALSLFGSLGVAARVAAFEGEKTRLYL